jgi:hypothetical protein
MLIADAGVPMLFVTFPRMMAALVPIVLVEAIVYRWYLSKSFPSCCGGSLVANSMSTFAGIPLTWVLLVIMEILCTGGGKAYGLDTPLHRLVAVTLQAPWLVPYEEDLYWMIPVAALSLLVPCLLVSVLVEYFMLRACWILPKDRVKLLNAVWIANLLSYCLLGTYCLVLVREAMGKAPKRELIGLAAEWWLALGLLIGGLGGGVYLLMRHVVHKQNLAELVEARGANEDSVSAKAAVPEGTR